MAQQRFENLVAQLQGVIPEGQLAAALNSANDAGNGQSRGRPRGPSNGDILELDLGVEGDGDEDDGDDGDLSSDIPPEYTGVLEAVFRLKNELPARLASDPAWAPGTIGRLWES